MTDENKEEQKPISTYTKAEVIEAFERELGKCEKKLEHCLWCQLITRAVEIIKARCNRKEK